MPKLWEIEHPWMCEPGDYRRPVDEAQTQHDSWAEFLDDLGMWDEDGRVVFRWDWYRYDPADLEPGDPAEVLHVFWVGQVTAERWSDHITVTADDEPAVRAWLTARYSYLMRLWAPLGTATIPTGIVG